MIAHLPFSQEDQEVPAMEQTGTPADRQDATHTHIVPALILPVTGCHLPSQVVNKPEEPVTELTLGSVMEAVAAKVFVVVEAVRAAAAL